jgi:4-alpha-glucanotransferase
MRAADDRAAGILLHPTSLPGHGIGELGPAALRFVDWLAAAGQTLWQVLPLVPVDEGGSPYNGLCSVGGNPLLLGIDWLREDGLLPDDAMPDLPPASADTVDFFEVTRWKSRLLGRAFQAFGRGAAPALDAPFRSYRREQSDWLDDLALFQALREHHGGASWTAWPAPIRRRDAEAIAEWTERLRPEVERHAFNQFLFARQWARVREYAAARGVRIIGDVPIFVAHDSADVWARRELFRVGPDGRPEVVAGVPPDYFSETGQRWGNPLYDWATMARFGYRWWKARIRHTLEQVDVIRIDHFRGFEAFWEIPADEPTAVNGHWEAGPGSALFRELERELGTLPLIAEDLGLITPEVEALRDELELPGMRVLQFAFDGDPSNPHLPPNYVTRSVAYPGTHDNDTLVGWWCDATPAEREQAWRLVGSSRDPEYWALLGLVWNSPANWAVAQVQDVLGLGAEHRMNRPGTTEGNWGWRVDLEALTGEHQAALLELTRESGRLPPHPREER